MAESVLQLHEKGLEIPDGFGRPSLPLVLLDVGSEPLNEPEDSGCGLLLPVLPENGLRFPGFPVELGRKHIDIFLLLELGFQKALPPNQEDPAKSRDPRRMEAH